jgi:molecular chaperone DnaK (HSP70)
MGDVRLGLDFGTCYSSVAVLARDGSVRHAADPSGRSPHTAITVSPVTGSPQHMVVTANDQKLVITDHVWVLKVLARLSAWGPRRTVTG